MSDPRTLNLADVLKLYPWPEQRVSAKAIHWLWTFDLPCDALQIWPHLIDTSRLNRAIGLAEMRFEEKAGVLHGSSRSAGILQKWVEVPWTWVWCRELVAERVYESGFPRYLRAIHRLDAVGPNRCILTVYIGFIPRGLIGRIAISVAKKFVEAGYRRVLTALAKEASVDRPSLYRAPPKALSPSVRERIAGIRAVLEDQPIDQDGLAALLDFIETADDIDATRLQVRRLAREYGVREHELLITCLYATRAGLLNLSWDVVCPHCRGVREELTRLSDVTKRGRCDICEIDFTTDTENAIEITFHIHPAIRDVPKVFFCSAEPAYKSHIRAQLNIPPKSTAIVGTDFAPGLYRLRSAAIERPIAIDVGAGGDSVLNWSVGTPGDRLQSGPGPELRFKNERDEIVPVVIEQATWADTALRPADVFCLQQFRDLFSEEYLTADTQLDVGEQTILFTDIVGSTRFYAERGDPGAFVTVKHHFGIIQSVLEQHHGAMIKSIGDAAMVVFPSPLQAVQAARDIMRQFPPTEGDRALRLRASIHTGPCIAVNLNAGVDYFGSTVNIAAKLQKCSAAGDITMSASVLRGTGVSEFLESCQAVVIHGTLPSDAGPIAHGVWKTESPTPRARGTHSEPALVL